MYFAYFYTILFSKLTQIYEFKEKNMFRNSLAVIAAYAVFVITSLALFNLSGHNPDARTTLNFQVLTAIYGIIFSFLSGLVLQLIAKKKNLNLNYILAFIMAGFATFSLIKADGSHWTQLLAIFIFAPTSVLGGFYIVRKTIK